MQAALCLPRLGVAAAERSHLPAKAGTYDMHAASAPLCMPCQCAAVSDPQTSPCSLTTCNAGAEQARCGCCLCGQHLHSAGSRGVLPPLRQPAHLGCPGTPCSRACQPPAAPLSPCDCHPGEVNAFDLAYWRLHPNSRLIISCHINLSGGADTCHAALQKFGGRLSSFGCAEDATVSLKKDVQASCKLVVAKFGPRCTAGIEGVWAR